MISTDTSKKASLLLIYTGGTIGMRQDPSTQTLRPFDFSQILEEVPELRKFAYRIDSYTFDPIIDSSDVEPGLWQCLAGLIKEKYRMYDGFVILHGTDTMAYSASALSFMLENLAKPVIFTGSQLPIGIPRTDGRENLVSAVEIAAAKDSQGHAIVPEVCIYFDNMLMRGNRACKISSDNFTAFRTLNLPPLAEAGISIKYNSPLIIKPDDWEADLVIHTSLDTRVSILKIHPGITPHVVRNILCGEETRAVIMETYGCGNAPSKEWFLNLVRQAASSGKILLNVTQCLSGTVDMNLYSNGKALLDAGVVSGYDSTTESALGKLFFLLGQTDDNPTVKRLLNKNFRGEISK
ncbi:MAG: type I asparaginase [Bacteroidetes bacterium]|uniref:asparaginase n=1 Tax=Candidatus Cryptobacteroides faecipullorum TaxID=2840764 RepID=A0A9D9I8I2_9BACT|nr:type I asparaginase [Candidatus Cryptobacteroides faecipullorum]